MTPEQFIFWVSGYITADKDSSSVVIINDIREALKHVKLNFGSVAYICGSGFVENEND